MSPSSSLLLLILLVLRPNRHRSLSLLPKIGPIIAFAAAKDASCGL